MDSLRSDTPGRPACAVHVYVVPELATYEATESAPDEARGSRHAGADGRGATRVATLRDVLGGPAATGLASTDWRSSGRAYAEPETGSDETEADETGSDETGSADAPSTVLPVALCVGARAGLLSDILDAVHRERPDVRLAGVTVAVLHGLAIVFLYCGAADHRGAADGELVAGDETGGNGRGRSAHPAAGLGAVIRASLESTDEIEVAVEGVPGAPASPAACQPSVPRPDGPLLRLQLRTPDRPGVVPAILARLASVIRHECGPAAGSGLDIWFALLRVVDGRSLQGRMAIWLPAGDWSAADWAPVTEDEQLYLPGGRAGERPVAEDDPVLSADLARVAAVPTGHG